MTLSAQEDFGGFVVARWGDLEAVALVTTLDPVTAREATTAALATLGPRWAATLEEGSPTTAARRALLERLVPARRARPGRPVPGATPPGPAPALAAPGAFGTPDDDAVPAALLRALTAEEPLVRCALAAEVVWDTPPPETGRLLGRPDVEDAVASARERLLAVHRGARADDGLGPADHLLEADLVDLVHRLTTTQPEPPDPDSLVGERVRRVRRRSVVAGGGVLAVAGAAAWWGLAGEEPAPARRSVATPSTAGPDDPAWRSSGRWPARGTLATDLGIQALVARAAPAARLLFADDVHDVRCVVAKTLLPDDVGGGTQLQLWAGSVGAPAEQLTMVPLGYSGIYEVGDVVAVGVPHPSAGVLLVLTRPSIDLAQYSLTARPTPAGLSSRTWRNVRLEAGVGSVLLDAPAGPATRVRCAGYDGPLPAPEAWAVRDSAEGLLLPDVAAITGHRPEDLRERVVVSRMPASVEVPDLGDGRVTVSLVIVTTPDGGVVRGVTLATEGPSGNSSIGSSPVVVPADLAEAPYLTRVDDLSGDAVWIVTVPPGGAEVRLRTDDDAGRAVGTSARVHGRAAVLRTPPTDGVAVVVRDARGRVLWDDRPVEGRDAYDTYPTATPDTVGG
ncbi:hypothetical protein [Phycicoccus sonneratiae]|uniref:DNA-directed RNA polymerase specialized sigma24 family protein n=1 Tax=Phycicoccus sonneratiae TaxID=2807628 RepID=A0ABS2CNQ1_9MICO|nr:hypothetical protein [Phycicoccus sonneraticus]MBM6401507.1 hypothetical protein [Phycicoccus sonneraticus]